jgi:hypothetical protein
MQSSNDSSRTIWTLAEELAARTMRGVEASANEYQAAEAAGEKHERTGRAEIANAGDLCGG